MRRPRRGTHSDSTTSTWCPRARRRTKRRHRSYPHITASPWRRSRRRDTLSCESTTSSSIPTIRRIRHSPCNSWHTPGTRQPGCSSITGADAFADIASWYDYPAVLSRSHFVVVSRSGCAASDLRRRLPDLAERMRRVEAPTIPAADEGPTAIWLVDAQTRSISSSDVRTQLLRGRPVDELVPPAVATYIARHALYCRGG